MRMAGGRVTPLIVLALWVLVGPLAATFACAATGMMCEGPCGVAPCPVQVPRNVSVMPLVATLAIPAFDEPPTPTLRVVDPPPKSLLAA